MPIKISFIIGGGDLCQCVQPVGVQCVLNMAMGLIDVWNAVAYLKLMKMKIVIKYF